MKETILEIQDLALTYETRQGGVHAVRDVSLTVKRGEAVGLVGESGCGKSTVAFAAMGYLESNARVDRGQILFKGQNILDQTDKTLQSVRGKEIAMIYQDPMTTLNPSYRVGDQLVEVLTVHEHLSPVEARERCLEMLTKVRMPDAVEVMARYPHQLSGGQQQRVVIAMALLCNPDLLIMDEPTTALDVTVEASILDHIKALRGEFDSAILYVSHNLGVVARFCDRVAVMYAGELVEAASVNDIFGNPLHPYTLGLMGCVPKLGTCKATTRLEAIPGQVCPAYQRPLGCIFEPRCTFAQAACRQAPPQLEPVMEGRTVRCFRWQEIHAGTCLPSAIVSDAPERGPQPAAALKASLSVGEGREGGCKGPLLSVSNLKTYYAERSGSLFRRGSGRSVKAVDNVSFEMAPQTIVGIVGESGCGKSSLAKTVAGLVIPTAGEIEFLGVDVSKVVEKRDQAIVRELQMIFQNPDSSLNPTKSVAQIIARPLSLSGVVPRDAIKGEIKRLLAAVKLDAGYLNRRPWQLSGGQKQRVAIARALASRPELLVCDEPVSSLDVSVQCSVLNTLLEIQENFGTGLLFISHDLSVVRYLCDTIVVMYLGKVCEAGPSDLFFSPPYHPYTEALLSAVPVPDPRVQQARIRLQGSPPSAIEPPSGCRFHTRCPRKVGAICETDLPPARSVGDGAVIYCHIPLDELQCAESVICRAE